MKIITEDLINKKLEDDLVYECRIKLGDDLIEKLLRDIYTELWFELDADLRMELDNNVYFELRSEKSF